MESAREVQQGTRDGKILTARAKKTGEFWTGRGDPSGRVAVGGFWMEYEVFEQEEGTSGLGIIQGSQGVRV